MLSPLYASPKKAEKAIRLGHIGLGGQGSRLLRNFLGQDLADPVAICDPFKQRREAAGQLVLEKREQRPALYNDFRNLLADKSLDAVVIATPDHWHVPIGLAAVRAGKDVYIEKPLGHSLAQNKAMLDACKKYNRVFQYGTMQRSQEMIKRGIELVLNGYIGDLERIEVWAPEGHGGGSLDEIPVPRGLDYDLYLGPAPMRPCTADRITSDGSWYCSDYSLGMLASWGAHPLDIAIWGMDSDTKGDFTVRGTGDFPTPHGLFDTCATWDADLHFHDGVTLRFMSSNFAKDAVLKYRPDDWQGDGTTFFGTKGWISLSRNSYAASNPSWLKLDPCEGDRRVKYHFNYYKTFLHTVNDRSTSITPIDDAVRSDAISHLTNIAIKSGRELTWDPVAYQLKSPVELDSHTRCQVRGDWKQS